MRDKITIDGFTYIREENNFLENYNRKLKADKLEEDSRREFVRRNIPTILDLVKEFNEVCSVNPETADDARKQNELSDSLAHQIVKYVI